jgi:hypothetical protein
MLLIGHLKPVCIKVRKCTINEQETQLGKELTEWYIIYCKNSWKGLGEEIIAVLKYKTPGPR